MKVFGFLICTVSSFEAPNLRGSAEPSMTVHNNCPFELQATFNHNQQPKSLLKTGESKIFTGPISNGRIYFAPSDAPESELESLGYLEYTYSTAKQFWTDPSMIDGIGLPIRFDYNGRSTGCDSTNYQGYEAFQDLVKNHCPGKTAKLSSSVDLTYCHGTYSNDIEGTAIESTWDLAETNGKYGQPYADGDCSASAFSSDTQAKTSIGNCQGQTSCKLFGLQPDGTTFGPGTGGAMCARLNRGTTELKDAQQFYRNPQPYDPTKTDKIWKFNPYSAFVHLVCGINVYGHPTDDHTAHDGLIIVDKGQNLDVTLCPAAGDQPSSPGVLPAGSDHSSVHSHESGNDESRTPSPNNDESPKPSPDSDSGNASDVRI